MAAIKTLAKSLAILAGLFLSFRYLADFSRTQSEILAVIAWAWYQLYANLEASLPVEKPFSPFYVSVIPKWWVLLRDFKLIHSIEEWQRIAEMFDKAPSYEYNVIRSGISFTIIRPLPDCPPGWERPGLTYWNSRKMVVSEVDFSESIVEIEATGYDFGEQHPFLKHPRWADLPKIFFRWGVDGFGLALEVQEDWWKRLCETGEIGELAKTFADTNHLTGTTRLLVATLPYSEFAIYYQGVEYDAKRLKKQQENRDQRLAENGWERKDRPYDPEDGFEDPWSHVEHKYFEVAHRAV